jgi:hypothetical protein
VRRDAGALIRADVTTSCSIPDRKRILLEHAEKVPFSNGPMPARRG